ncbi:MAG: hypothetical protein R3E66_22480 [bacterium]
MDECPGQMNAWLGVSRFLTCLRGELAFMGSNITSQKPGFGRAFVVSACLDRWRVGVHDPTHNTQEDEKIVEFSRQLLIPLAERRRLGPLKVQRAI